MIILIGLPGSGKSTWTTKFLEKNSDYVVISSDNIIDELCSKEGISYTEGYSKFIGIASKKFKTDLFDAIDNQKNIIIDRTNMSKKARKVYFRHVDGKNYDVEAVSFSINDNELKKRLKIRAEKTGKFIPEHVIDDMASNYDRPSKEEGFSNITFIKI